MITGRRRPRQNLRGNRPTPASATATAFGEPQEIGVSPGKDFFGRLSKIVPNRGCNPVRPLLLRHHFKATAHDSRNADFRFARNVANGKDCVTRQAGGRSHGFLHHRIDNFAKQYETPLAVT